MPRLLEEKLASQLIEVVAESDRRPLAGVAVALLDDLSSVVALESDDPGWHLLLLWLHLTVLLAESGVARSSLLDGVVRAWEMRAGELGKTTLGGHEANLAIALNKFRAHDAGKGGERA